MAFCRLLASLCMRIIVPERSQRQYVGRPNYNSQNLINDVHLAQHATQDPVVQTVARGQDEDADGLAELADVLNAG